MKSLLITLAALGMVFTGLSTRADEILWLDDFSGHVGEVDITTQSVVAGSVITVTSPGFDLSSGLSDIAFTSSRTLYGSTFTNLFSINTATGAATNLGAFNAPNIDALVGDGPMLVGAGDASTTVYSINPAAPGSLSAYATSPAVSAGDLAFAGSTLYESGISNSGADELVNVSTGTVIGLFHVASTGGATVGDVYGLADDGTAMYAAAGTEIYKVNLANGVLTPLFDYGGQGLTQARGSAFLSEAANPVPLPATAWLLMSGMGGLLAFCRKKGAA